MRNLLTAIAFFGMISFVNGQIQSLDMLTGLLSSSSQESLEQLNSEHYTLKRAFSDNGCLTSVYSSRQQPADELLITICADSKAVTFQTASISVEGQLSGEIDRLRMRSSGSTSTRSSAQGDAYDIAVNESPGGDHTWAVTLQRTLKGDKDLFCASLQAVAESVNHRFQPILGEMSKSNQWQPEISFAGSNSTIYQENNYKVYSVEFSSRDELTQFQQQIDGCLDQLSTWHQGSNPGLTAMYMDQNGNEIRLSAQSGKFVMAVYPGL